MNPSQLTENRSATKIIATIGPASEDRIGELIQAGLSVARINFSHGDEESHRRMVRKIREAEEEQGMPVGILADLQGPKLRLGRFEDAWLDLAVGQELFLRAGDGIADPGEVLFDFEGFREAVKPGERVFLADGAVELVVDERDGEGFRARVARGGRVGDRKGVHLPDSDFQFELPTPQDRVDIALAREIGVNMLGVSFVSRAAEIERVRGLAGDLLLVAKLERRPALRDKQAIIAASDGVMVARGDLGVEVPFEELPIVQKGLVQDALRQGRFAIIATEMLESMVHASRPTRAEVSDVATAVLDGADAVMLSAETAMGEHPVLAVEAMSRIAQAVEHSVRYHELPQIAFREEEQTFSNAVAMCAVRAANALGLRKIICFTETGNTVRLISRYRPDAQVIALTPNPRTLHYMTVLSHVQPLLCPRRASLEEMLFEAQALLLDHGLVRRGEEVAFVAGVPTGVARSTNVMKLHRIGDEVRLQR